MDLLPSEVHSCGKLVGVGTGIDYVVNDEGLTDEEVKAIDRAALATLGGDAVHVETDLPGHDPGAWPADVEAAAEALRRHAGHPETATGDYLQVEVDLRAHPHLWEAFVLVAPHAFDAAVHDSYGTELAYLVDEGDMGRQLSAEQYQRMAQAIGVERLLRPHPRAPRLWWAPWRRRPQS